MPWSQGAAKAPSSLPSCLALGAEEAGKEASVSPFIPMGPAGKIRETRDILGAIRKIQENQPSSRAVQYDERPQPRSHMGYWVLT